LKTKKEVKAERQKVKGEGGDVEKTPSLNRLAPTEKEVKAESEKVKGLPAESENPPPVNRPAPPELNKSEIENPTSEITMEVHHHPDLHHEKKPWKEYLLEGLMIFVAVVMGFIAENVRESITEHKRATEFAQSYYTDIKKDTVEIDHALRFGKHRMAAIDSILTVLHQPPSPHGDTVLAYKAIVASAVLPFEPSSGNFEATKASGAVRNFRQKMINLMNEYDLQARAVIRRDDITQKFITEQMIPSSLSRANFETSYDLMTTGKINHEVDYDWSKNWNKTYINMLVFDKTLTLRSMQEYKKLYKKAENVLAELKNEYDLEDE
jgi:hypothetical protein